MNTPKRLWASILYKSSTRYFCYVIAIRRGKRKALKVGFECFPNFQVILVVITAFILERLSGVFQRTISGLHVGVVHFSVVRKGLSGMSIVAIKLCCIFS